jgi:PAS domain S-box-containing protein
MNDVKTVMELTDYSLLDGVSTGILIINSQQEIMFLNKSLSEKLHIEPRMLIGKNTLSPFLQILSQDEDNMVDQFLFDEELCETRLFQCRIHNEETIRLFELSKSVVCDTQGDWKYSIITISDMTATLMDEPHYREAEHRFDTLIQAMDELIFTVNTDHIYTGLYGKWMDRHHPEGNRIIGKRVEDVVRLTPGSKHKAAMDAAFRGSSYTYECEFEINGKSVDFHVSVSPIRNDDGAILSILGVARDITAENILKKDLKASKDLYQKLIEHSPEMIFVQQDERVEYMNPAGVKLLKGDSSSDFIGKSIYDFIHHEYHGIVKQRLAHLHVNKNIGVLEEKFVCLDGTILFLEVHATQISMNNQTGSLVFARDISLRREAIQSFVQSEEKFRQLAENISDIFWIKDIASECFTYISPGFEKLIGISSQTISHLDFSPLQSYKIEQDNIDSADENGKMVSYSIKLPNGERRWIKERVFYVRNTDSHMTRIAGVAEDITYLKEKEALLHKQKKLLMLQNLAAGIAHEVRNPLTSIKGFLQLMNDRIPDHYYQLMELEILNIEKFIEQILQLGKNGNSQLNPVVIVDLLEEAVYKNRDAESRLSMNATGLTRETKLLGNEQQLIDILNNLIENAMDSIENLPFAKVVVEAVTEDDCVNINIRDNGKGICPERLKTLGEPHFANHEKGIGLGWMICKKLIEVHKGQLTIQSKLNEGTTVTIKLPIL